MVFIAIIYRSQSCEFSEHITESTGIIVAYFIHYLRDILAGIFKASLGGFYFYPLYIFYYRIMCCLLEAALKASSADSVFGSEFINGDHVIIIIFNELLSFLYFSIRMFFLSGENDKGCLALFININHE